MICVMDFISFDTETELIKPGIQAPRMVSAAFQFDDQIELLHHTEAREAVEEVLYRDVLVVGHNVAFDFSVVAVKWPDLVPAIFDKYERNEVSDTEICAKLLDIASTRRYRGQRYALDVCIKRVFGQELDKDTWRLRYGELYDVPIEEWPQGAIKYACDDALWTHRLYQHQIEQPCCLEDQFRQARAAFWMQLMRMRGLRTDPEAVQAFGDRLEKEFKGYQKDLVEAGYMTKAGARKANLFKQYIYDHCVKNKIPVSLTAKGKELLAQGKLEEKDVPRYCKTDSETLEELGGDLMIAYARVSSVKKQISTDLKLLRRGVIQARFDTLKETGRTSTKPNVQNLPTEGGMRECFVPRPGFVFAAADYSAFELRTVSQVVLTELGIHSRLAEKLNAGMDPHLEIARLIVGGDENREIPYEEAVEMRAAKHPGISKARKLSKVVNFGFWGGMGAKTFVRHAKGQGQIITEREAYQLKAYWSRAWPESKKYFDKASESVDKGPGGRGRIEQLFVGRWRGGCLFTEVCNTKFQGLAADAAKHAGWLLAAACYAGRPRPDGRVKHPAFGEAAAFLGSDWVVYEDPCVSQHTGGRQIVQSYKSLNEAVRDGWTSVLYGSKPVNFVHDEFIAEVPDTPLAHDCAVEMQHLMEVGAGKYLPDVPPIAEPYLMRRWSKDAEPIFDSRGRLVPWDLESEKAA